MGFETPTPPELQNTHKPIEEPKLDGETAGRVQKTRERILSLFEFNKLKLREYFGKIDENQLQSLLELEFEQSKKDTPPIYDVFDPEAELQALRALPREQKREALTEFKSKLARQREAWATCRTFLRRKIEINHDVEKQDLMDWVDRFSDEYGFTDSQRQTAEEIIDDYYENRQRVIEIREQYPSDVELVNHITGLNFSKDTKFKVEISQMNIVINCDSFNSCRIYKGSTDVTINYQHSGFTMNRNGVNIVVINSSIADKMFQDYSQSKKGTLIHENQHREHALFENQFEQEWSNSDLWNQYQEEQDPQIKGVLLEKYLKEERNRALVRVKNELFACLYNHKIESDYIVEAFFSSHDYLNIIRKREDTQLFSDYSQRILTDEYRELIKSAISTLVQLKKKGGYSTEQTIALLTDKPVTQWSKTARRLLEEDK